MPALTAESMTASARTAEQPRANVLTPVSAVDHVRGTPEALITLVEYGDFECNACGAAYRLLKGLVHRNSARMRVVFRHMPSVQSHPNAQWAAEAAESAGVQGLFWDLHDALFEHQAALSPEFIRKMARRLGVDLQRFDADMRTRRFAERVKSDLDGGIRSGVTHTPTFFINGVRFEGSLDGRSLSMALDRPVGMPRSA